MPHEEDRKIDEARLNYQEVDIEPEANRADRFPEEGGRLCTEYIEQRKLALVERVKDIAPDWDEMTTRELLH